MIVPKHISFMRKKAIFTYGGKHLAALCLFGMAAMSSPAMASGLSPDRSEAILAVNAAGNTVKSVLTYIEGHSKYVFVYGQNVKNRLDEKVQITLEGKTAEKILDELCRKTGMKYTISGRQVTITVDGSKKAQDRQNPSGGVKRRSRVLSPT